jgi:hypothetical protein
LTSFSGWKQIIFKRQDFNEGNGYDLATGVFTAPVAGWYQFDLLGLTGTVSGQYSALGVADFPSLALRSRGNKRPVAADHESTAISRALDLNEGQKIAPVYYGAVADHTAGGGHPDKDPEGLRHYQFSGFLIAPRAT